MSELLLVAALVLAVGAMVLLAGAAQSDYRERVLDRMQSTAGEAPRRSLYRRFRDWSGDRLAGAGIEPHPWQGWVLLAGMLASLFAGGHFHGPLGLLAAPLGLMALLYMFWAWRRNRRARKLLEQLPGFMGHALRALRAGSSLEQALDAATAESDGVVAEAFARIMRHANLGMAVDEALLRTAELYRLRELDMLALAVRVTRRYGGDLGEIMESIAGVIRTREAAHRELQAMTGETRLSAWILAGLPIALAGFIMITTPEYLDRALENETGRYMLIGAVIWQVFGLLLLRRMVKVA